MRPTDSKATTMPEFIDECFKRNGNKDAMAWRDLKDVIVETKQITKVIDGKPTKVNKDWTYYEMGPYNYIKYPELLKLVQNYSKGLLELGLLPDQQSKLMVLPVLHINGCKHFSSKFQRDSYCYCL